MKNLIPTFDYWKKVNYRKYDPNFRIWNILSRTEIFVRNDLILCYLKFQIQESNKRHGTI